MPYVTRFLLLRMYYTLVVKPNVASLSYPSFSWTASTPPFSLVCPTNWPSTKLSLPSLQPISIATSTADTRPLQLSHRSTPVSLPPHTWIYCWKSDLHTISPAWITSTPSQLQFHLALPQNALRGIAIFFLSPLLPSSNVTIPTWILKPVNHLKSSLVGTRLERRWEPAPILSSKNASISTLVATMLPKSSIRSWWQVANIWCVLSLFLPSSTARAIFFSIVLCLTSNAQS